MNSEIAPKKGYHLTEEHKRKISLSKKGVKLSEEARRKLSEGQLRCYETHEARNKGGLEGEQYIKKIIQIPVNL